MKVPQIIPIKDLKNEQAASHLLERIEDYQVYIVGFFHQLDILA